MTEMATESVPAEEIVREGIHTLAIPTPFAVGRVNVYLIEDDPLTLIDTGPNSGKSLDELEQQLKALGHAIEDIELLILTHQHLDHIGLAQIIVQRSGAEVMGIDKMAGFLENFSNQADQDDEYAQDLMLRYGIPEDVVRALAAVSRSFRGWGASVKITRPLADGESVELKDRKLETHWRPGHSPSDTVFWDERRRLLIAGDHLLKMISSNPLMHRPLEDEVAEKGPRPQALVTYLESLKKTREMPAKLVLAGHGDPITDHRTLINERLELHRHRAEKVFNLIAKKPSTAYELAQGLWGNVAVTQAFLTLSEIVGHADLLLNEGRIREVVNEDGVVVFETAT